MAYVRKQFSDVTISMTLLRQGKGKYLLFRIVTDPRLAKKNVFELLLQWRNGLQIKGKLSLFKTFVYVFARLRIIRFRIMGNLNYLRRIYIPLVRRCRKFCERGSRDSSHLSGSIYSSSRPGAHLIFSDHRP